MSDSDNMTMRLIISGDDEASTVLRAFQREVKKTEKLAENLSKSFSKPSKLTAFEGADKIAKQFEELAGKVKAATDTLRSFEAEARKVRGVNLDVGGMGGGGSGGGRGGSDRGFADWRTRQRIKATTLRQEAQEANRAARAERSRSREEASHDRDRFRLQMRWMRQQEAEQRRAHRESLRMRREAVREESALSRRVHRGLNRYSGGHRSGHGHLGIHGSDAGLLSAPAYAAIGGLTTAILGLKSTIEATIRIDDATTRLRMFGANMSEGDVQAARSKALRDSIGMGVGAEHLLNAREEALRSGVTPDIASAMTNLVPKAAAAMGETVEKVGNTLSEGIQQAYSMGLVKTHDDARRFANVTSGMSNYGGNNADKTTQALDSGVIGHGKELGWSLSETMAAAAAFNAMGSRTGQATSRFMGDIASVIPSIGDKVRKAMYSHTNSAENRAVRNAPMALGYRSIEAMTRGMSAGPEGFGDFAGRVGKLPEEQRKLTLKGLGLTQQGSAIIAEIGANPQKFKDTIAHGRELEKQKEGQDYLSTMWTKWSASFSFMLRQVEAGWNAIEAELGDVFRSDVLQPFRDLWVEWTQSLLDGGLRARFHTDLMSFVNGLGFKDVADMLARMKASVGSFDAPAFFRGVGEGIANVVALFKGLAHAIGLLTGSGDAETIGKLGAEFFGLALGAAALGPVLGIFGSVIGIFRSMVDIGRLPFDGAAWTGLTDAIGTLVKLPFGEAAAGLARLLGPLVAMIGLAKVATDKGMLQMPKSFTMEGLTRFLDPGLADRLFPKSPDGTAKLEKQSFSGTGDAARSGLLQPAAYIEWSDAKDSLRSIDTTVGELLDQAKQSSNLVRLASIRPGDIAPNMGAGGSGGGGSYGSPGSTRRYANLPDFNGPLGSPGGPETPLGPMGKARKGGYGKFDAKAPAIMAGLMSRYGLDREQAAGIVGNLGHESGAFTAFHEGGAASNKGGVGWAQWTGSRRRLFESWTKAHGLDPTSDAASWRFLTEGDPETAKAIAAVKRTHGSHAAMMAWEGSFERAGVKAYASRDKFADRALGLNPVVPDALASATKVSPADIASSASGAARAATKHHDGNVTVNVHTPSSDPKDHGKVAGEAARRAMYQDMYTL